MNENSFLKKFKGRTEQIGRGGISEVMNNVHINVIDYIPKKPKIKKPKIKVDPFGHIKSEISEVFNENIKFQPRTKDISLSPKKNNNEDEKKIKNNKFNKRYSFDELKKENKNNSNIINNKFNIKSKVENKKNIENTKGSKNRKREEPIKILNNINNNNKSAISKRKFNNIDNNRYQKYNEKNINNNKLIFSKKETNSLPLNLKLPLISKSPNKKKNIKDILLNNSNIQLNKKSERVNTYTPKIMNNLLNSNHSQIFNSNIKKSSNNKINYKSGNMNNNIINNKFNFPKIDKKYIKNINIEKDNTNNIKLYNKQKDIILNNIKNDFLMLNSIKSRANNNISKSQIFEDNNHYQNNNNIKNYINTNNKEKSNYLNNINNYQDIRKQNNLNKNYNKIKSRNNPINEEINFEAKENKKPHTSFDAPQKIPKLINKLDIIHEENEEDNKYLTDLPFNNSFENQENLNSLEILMKQRANFQNKIPNNSRFKLK